MEYRLLSGTGILVSRISFGAGPVSGWMAELSPNEQCTVVRRALDAGINWFDTAAGYGDGQSERSLGAALAKLGHLAAVHVATKVRYFPEHLADIRRHTRESFRGSLERLGLGRVTLLQLHNSITHRRGDKPTSLAPSDILGPGGVLEAFEELRREGRIDHIGLTGIGDPAAMREVVRSGAFDTMQVPYNLLNPSAGHPVPDTFAETNYGNIIGECITQGMGVFAIRVFAGGVLAGRPPSAHTLKTAFFPLSLYQRDLQRAGRIRALLGSGGDLKAAALRFVLGHPSVVWAIIGFREPAEIDDAAAIGSDPLPAEQLTAFLKAAGTPLD